MEYDLQLVQYVSTLESEPKQHIFPNYDNIRYDAFLQERHFTNVTISQMETQIFQIIFKCVPLGV